MLHSFQSTTHVASYHGGCDCWAVGAVRSRGRINCSILERVELYFAANEIKADKRVPVFLNLTRRGNYTLLRCILSPQKPMEESLKKLMDVLREYYEPKKVVMAASFFFTSASSSLGSLWPYTWQNYERWWCPVSLGRL